MEELINSQNYCGKDCMIYNRASTVLGVDSHFLEGLQLFFTSNLSINQQVTQNLRINPKTYKDDKLFNHIIKDYNDFANNKTSIYYIRRSHNIFFEIYDTDIFIIR